MLSDGTSEHLFSGGACPQTPLGWPANAGLYLPDQLPHHCYTYESHRNADKQQLFESIFADLVSAFEALDVDDVLPDIYCEAIDLLSLELDPVSKRLKTNTKVLQSLCNSVESLPPKLVKPIQDQASSQLKSLNDFVESVQKLKDQLSCAMDVSIKKK